MVGGNDKDDVHIGRWINESRTLYANVANKAWLEWGQEILPQDIASAETKESMAEEEKRRINDIDDQFANGPMSFEEHEVALKALQVEMEV
jgi:Fe-S cluster biosynthesis and repair protein YggX